MRVLVVEDDATSRRRLGAMLERWGHDVCSASDGEQALSLLSSDAGIGVVILDWMLPATSGVDVCRELKQRVDGSAPYVILLTSKREPADVLEGLGCGADQYLTKPFDREDLKARVQLGSRAVELQRQLATRVVELEEALHRTSQLEGLLPICCYCKRIRNADNEWQGLERFIQQRSNAEFSHGICPHCLESVKDDLGMS